MTDTNTNTTGSTSTSTTSPYSILSDKVNRAISIRTDTPAMKAALDALSTIKTTSNSTTNITIGSNNTTNNTNNNCNTTSITFDSRNVRTAIEYDALNQALVLQESLRSIVTTVQQLRVGVSTIKSITKHVHDIAHNNNTNTNTNNTTTSTSSTILTTTTNTTNSNNNEEEDESSIAKKLIDAFIIRNNAKQKYITIQQFFEQYDLNEYDNYLLEYYNFTNITAGITNSTCNNNNESELVVQVQKDTNTKFDPSTFNTQTIYQFLNALDRVRTIRIALQKQQLTEQKQHYQQQVQLSLYDNSINESNDNSTSSSSSTSTSTDAAIRIIQSLADKQERAYERLYRWLQIFLRLIPTTTTTTSTFSLTIEEETSTVPIDYYYLLLSSSSNNDSSNDSATRTTSNTNSNTSFIYCALQTLKYVPPFYCHIIELIATQRRTETTKRFLIALTDGIVDDDNNNTILISPPIEMKSHDPVAYVGDMLAFAFKSFSVEADIAKGLLESTPNNKKDEDDNDNETKTILKKSNNDEKSSDDDDDYNMENDNYNNEDDDEFHSQKMMGSREMLAISMSGLSRPLKSRIIHVIASLSRRPGVDADTTSKQRMTNDNSGNNDNDSDEDDDDDTNEIDFGEECSRFRNKVVNLYDLCGLLLFYISAMNKTINKLEQQQEQESFTGTGNSNINNKSDNPLVTSLYECLQDSTRAYEATARVYCAIIEQWSINTGELESSLIYTLLVQIADSRLSSPGFYTIEQEQQQQQQQSTLDDNAADDTNKEQQQKVTNHILDDASTILSMEWISTTFIESCKCISLDDIMYLQQSYDVCNKAGLDTVTQERLQQYIQLKQKTLIEEFVINEVNTVLDMCGLLSIITSYKQFMEEYNNNNSNQEGITKNLIMKNYPGLSANDIESSISDFYTSLYSPPIPNYEIEIKDATIRRTVRTEICIRICNYYEQLYNSIVNNNNNNNNNNTTNVSGEYSSTTISVFEHHPNQVRTLFSV